VAEQKPNAEAVFTLEKIYLKDVSFESPAAPAVFLKNEQPELSIQLGLGHSRLDAERGYHEVVLTVTVTAKAKEATLFLAEVQQGGIFRVHGVPEDARQRTLETACPQVLLPFAREAVSELVSKGGFPPLLISPVNFESLYEQKLAAQRQQAAGNA
jgi:preprotein translocase subunit SecB